MKWLVPFLVSFSTLLSTQSSDTTYAEKSPTRAVLYSLIPGGGQVYNGKYLKAILILSAELYVAYQFRENRVAYRDWTEDSDLPKHRYREKRNKYAWWAGFIYVYNLVDALVDSHLSSFDTGEFQEEIKSVDGTPHALSNLRKE
ncbi:MAG: DUF5683 domain-containing protein [Candidatus Neomarinimicrobiota bacterium]